MPGDGVKTSDDYNKKPALYRVDEQACSFLEMFITL